MIRSVITFTLFAITPNFGVADAPRSAPPFETLVATSDLIVAANVLKVSLVPGKHFAIAQLQVNKCIKGTVDAKRIDALFDQSPFNQRPAPLKAGKPAVVFLKRPIAAKEFIDRSQDPFASSEKFDRIYQGTYRIAFAAAGVRLLADHDLQELTDRIGEATPAKKLDAKHLERINDFVGKNVEITAQYSNDGANNGLLIGRLYIPVRFAWDRAPNNHRVTVTGLLKPGGKFRLLDHATWNYPPGPIKIYPSNVQLQEVESLQQVDPFRGDAADGR